MKARGRTPTNELVRQLYSSTNAVTKWSLKCIITKRVLPSKEMESQFVEEKKK